MIIIAMGADQPRRQPIRSLSRYGDTFHADQDSCPPFEASGSLFALVNSSQEPASGVSKCFGPFVKLVFHAPQWIRERTGSVGKCIGEIQDVVS